MSRMMGKGKNADTVGRLKQENSRLKYLAEADWLTGIYNRGAMERKTDDYLKDGKSGFMIMFDLDYFKQVNDRYGHIIGDQLLQHIGKVLGKMYPKNSLVGRIGGDEFVIFLLGECSEKEMDEKCVRMKKRFQEVRLQNKIIVKLSMSVAWAEGRDGDCYRSIFDRVDQKIMNQKIVRNMKKRKIYEPDDRELGGIRQDMRLIANEMDEEEIISGAYCQDYETFKILYQLELRRMRRQKKEIYLILFTLLNKNNNFLSLEQHDLEMETLGTQIQKCLRQGDVFTQYSNSQYLVMVPDTDTESVEIIAQRIRKAYYGSHQNETDHLMLHRSYPLSPVHCAG